jgi:hypothetical protein
LKQKEYQVVDVQKRRSIKTILCVQNIVDDQAFDLVKVLKAINNIGE